MVVMSSFANISNGESSKGGVNRIRVEDDVVCGDIGIESFRCVVGDDFDDAVDRSG